MSRLGGTTTAVTSGRSSRRYFFGRRVSRGVAFLTGWDDFLHSRLKSAALGIGIS